ncbi:hypothetical protein JTB14_001623 [Gonioctena quinquepunctata]|nr:hypothetical protein JTB14_001623 [Gonioctena quinquepunctata]
MHNKPIGANHRPLGACLFCHQWDLEESMFSCRVVELHYSFMYKEVNYRFYLLFCEYLSNICAGWRGARICMARTLQRRIFLFAGVIICDLHLDCVVGSPSSVIQLIPNSGVPNTSSSTAGVNQVGSVKFSERRAMPS